jgi:hypothetical protein
MIPMLYHFERKRDRMAKVPEHVKVELEQKANTLVETALKPAHVKPPPEDARFNYIVDIYTKWYRNYFYFCAKYHVPGPDAIEPSFEAKFARMEYTGNDRFALSFMRYTKQWVELYIDLSMDECLSAIQDEPFFTP